jgi:hypothetical protein
VREVAPAITDKGPFAPSLPRLGPSSVNGRRPQPPCLDAWMHRCLDASSKSSPPLPPRSPPFSTCNPRGMRHVATPAPTNTCRFFRVHIPLCTRSSKCGLKAQRVTPTQEVGCQDHVAVGGFLVGKQGTEARRPRDIASSQSSSRGCLSTPSPATTLSSQCRS